MARRRKKGRDIHGWVVLDKPVNMTSTQAVSKVRWLFDAKKAGHAGTLDPLASGCLPIALGEATKTVPYAMDGRKVYEFSVRFGAETTTDDLEGPVTQTSDSRPSRDDILAILPDFTGVIQQVPPQFSAIKVDGERAYDIARDGETVALAAREIVVHALTLTDMPDADTATFQAECSKGTYVRALARDMGRVLGAFGHVVHLRRLLVGPFNEDAMISLEELEELRHSAPGDADVAAKLCPVETVLDDIPALAITAAEEARLKQGQSIIMRGQNAPVAEGAAYATHRGQIVALGEIKQASFQPTRVFNLAGLTAAGTLT